jgi:hypothetical protein
MGSRKTISGSNLRGRLGPAWERANGPLRIVVIAAVVLAFLALLLSASDLLAPANSIRIDSVGTFDMPQEEIETVRPDIFREGHFSIFDILVHLDGTGKIDLEYHFDKSMNTHVIDSLEGKKNWWYEAYYDGGWLETNVFRMDHYPYKEKMFIKVFPTDKNRLQNIYDAYSKEVSRKATNNGSVVIPWVIIQGPGSRLTFQDVEVSAHDLRDDMLQEGVITAIDVIMSLGDQGKLTYDLNWYEDIGNAEVRNYFVDGINEWKARNRCGFVYEEGDTDLKFGNHIHIPSDIRVINSPGYEEWFWICI